MGTRSLTYVYEGKKEDWAKPFMCMYRQFDGYPEGHGWELSEFLMSGRLVTGLSGMGKSIQFNGMNCLAAQLVARFKTDSGGIYLYAPELEQDLWQAYEYHVWEDVVRITDTESILFEGSWKEFQQFCLNPVVAE